jgi:ribosomal protein L40E
MSSATSTERLPSKADGEKPASQDSGLEPWQFFVLAALGCATAALFASRGQGLTAVILLTILMATAAVAGLSVLRTVKPLVSSEDDRTAMIGGRTRAALEREKALSLRAIKELEFDRAMGKLSDEDWREMSGRLRARAAGLIRQLDAGTGYRDRIEQDLTRRLGTIQEEPAGRAAGKRVCSHCDAANDADARFCKSCGQRL